MEIEFLFKAWKTSRNLYLEYFDKFTLEQLNKIPQGFNNNLIWNIGHVIVAQQALIYKGTSLSGHIPDELFDMYKPGTKPTKVVSKSEIEELRGLLTSVIEKTEEDFYNGNFKIYNERKTGTGFHLSSLMDAFEFNNYHEGLHLGHMMCIKKFI
ncbi:DinB family protein [Reichenbachiella versicolor]|uniref:DinB family protein n=1 Tax=Reichenbachiella versicolor TaxID=1821036 RepID=UPI001FE4CC1C|nr:DinB family protein [Reichenbachiella versicolor]